MGSKLFDVANFDTLLLAEADTAGPRFSVYKKVIKKLYLLLLFIQNILQNWLSLMIDDDR